MRFTRELRRFLIITGVVLIVVGATDLVLGAALHDLGGVGVPAADSDARFAGGYLLGSGVVWIQVGRQARPPTTLVRLLAAALLIGGTGRLISLAVAGFPGALALVQTIVEIVVPLIVLGLSALSSRADQPSGS